MFKKKASTNRLVKFWKSADELAGLVALSLANTIKMFPAVGWIRANKAASEDLLTEINDLRKENAQLRLATGEFRPVIENLAGLQDKIEFHGTCTNKHNNLTQKWTAKVTWGEIFGCVSPYMARHPTDESVKSTLTSYVFEQSSDVRFSRDPALDAFSVRVGTIVATGVCSERSGKHCVTLAEAEITVQSLQDVEPIRFGLQGASRIDYSKYRIVY